LPLLSSGPGPWRLLYDLRLRPGWARERGSAERMVPLKESNRGFPPRTLVPARDKPYIQAESFARWRGQADFSLSSEFPMRPLLRWLPLLVIAVLTIPSSLPAEDKKNPQAELIDKPA